MSEMYHSSSSMEAFSSIEAGEIRQQHLESDESSFSGDSGVFCNEIPLAAVFSGLVEDVKEGGPGKQKHSAAATAAGAAELEQQEIVSVYEALSSPLSLPRLSSCNSPQTLHNVSPVSAFSEDSGRNRTLAGMLKELIQSKLSFKFHTPDTCIPHKSQENELENNLSPTTVLHRHTESSSPTLNSILPFPASFPAVKSPMEALILANSFSFSMSQAVPESPEVHAVSPLSFDAGSPCEHLLPGRFDYYSARNGEHLKAKTGPQRLHTSAGMWRKSISFNSNGDFFLPRKTSRTELVNSAYRSKSMTAGISSTNPENVTSEVSLKESENVAASRSSSKGSNTTTTTTASSEFSIDLSGKPAGVAALEMNSSRYLELDFNKEEVYNNTVYDIKRDIRSRVEEVVRKKDESKFTSSPIASSFLFAKSASRGTSTGIMFSGSLEGYIDLQPDQGSTTPEKKPGFIQRMRNNSSRNSPKARTGCCPWTCFWMSSRE